MSRWSELSTEQANPASRCLDELPTEQMLALMNREDARVAPAVATQLPAIAAAVDMVAARLGDGGRLFYVGAGTSGRLGILDAAECPPTFNTPPAMVQGLIAGGREAAFRAVEGAEDHAQRAVTDLDERGLAAADVVMGIAASGVTPYVHGALRHARALGCATIFFTCSPSALAMVDADVKIAPEVGPEVVTGSTRLKAGTATKLVLNMVTTGAMVRLGKTFGNWMVDLQPTNAKLRDRTLRILTTLTGLATDPAEAVLAAAGGSLKTALVMQLRGVDADRARALLVVHGGAIRQVLASPSTTGE